MTDEKVVVLKAQPEPTVPANKIHLKLKPIDVPKMIDVNVKELANKINQIIFMLNELNVRINKEDEVAMKKWADFMEKNK
jgi:hypothetical protein